MRTVSVMIAVAILLAAVPVAPPEPMLTIFSIAGFDPESGDLGIAVAR